MEKIGAYLRMYKNQGYLLSGYSNYYGDAFFSTYGAVKFKDTDLFKIFRRIDSFMKAKEMVIVAIDGNCGAGKTTLANFIQDVYDCHVFHMDDFFLTPKLRTKERLQEIGGNVDYVRFRQEVIGNLHKNCKFQYGIYDCKRDLLRQHEWVTPKKLNIIEGTYSMHPTLIYNYDLKIFLHVNKTEQQFRILKRCGLSMLEKFIYEWIPLEDRYFKKFKIEEQSDLVLNTTVGICPGCSAQYD